MKTYFFSFLLCFLTVYAANAQNTWNNSSTETRTSGSLSVGSLSYPAGRKVNIFTSGNLGNFTSLYGIYNQLNGSGNATKFGIYNLVSNSSGNALKYGMYTKVNGTSRAIGIYSWVPSNSSDSWAAYFRGKVLINATIASDVDAFGVWKSIQSYSFLVKRDGRTFANTLRLGSVVNVNDLNGTIRYTSTDGFQGYRNGSWGSLGGGVWTEFGNNIAYEGGNVFIGTNPNTYGNPSGYRLLVDGKIIGEEVRVQMSNDWPDYVFTDGHTRLSLDELSRFIEKENHLPGVPSAAEVKAEGGIDVGEMERILLEKVEELTLYMIEMKKENDALKQRIELIETNSNK